LKDSGKKAIGTLANSGGARVWNGPLALLHMTNAPSPRLRVLCKAQNLRYVEHPLMVGHYEQDPISGAEALIDRWLLKGELTMRHRLGIYAGKANTATVVLIKDSESGLHSGQGRGAVVIGLGVYGELNIEALTEAVRIGTLRYLLQIVDRHDSDKDIEVIDTTLSSMLMGYSSTTISIEDCISALLRGVLAANEQFAVAMPNLVVRVTTLEIIEMYLDTAITVARALPKVAEQINRGQSPNRLPIEAASELKRGKGFRHRLDASPSFSHWNRLIITDADASEDAGAAQVATQPSPERSRHANRLRYLYLGQRARAEVLLRQAQPGLVESLVRQSIDNTAANSDFCRTLFQLLIPTEFKDLVRHLDNLVLVVDRTTANLPWELLRADAEPVALQMRMVRQLQSPRFRPHLRQSLAPKAFVLGNPCTEGFYDVFCGGDDGRPNQLASLSGAEREAMSVAALLDQHQYYCKPKIGKEATALKVLNELYLHPYRLLHIAAHGCFEAKTTTGEERTGVVLSNGLLITAAEFNAMESVPELVFLNCCHLAVSDDAMVAEHKLAYNKLAYSVASELIEMGVRAVVACGWAVNDDAAKLFAETFYKEMLANSPFGEAVFKARQATYRDHADTNTWGAYQAYGDPSFLLNQTPTEAGASHGSAHPLVAVTPEELIVALEDLLDRAWREQEGAALSAEMIQDLAGKATNLVGAAPPQWLQDPGVAVALGDLYGEFGADYFDEARRFYREAIGRDGLQDDDSEGRVRGEVPMHCLLQLAVMEARQGEITANEGLIQVAINRLEALVRLQNPDTERDYSPATINCESLLALARAHQGMALIQARRLLLSNPLSQERAPLEHALQQALVQSIRRYRQSGNDCVSQRPLLHALALKAVLGAPRAPEHQTLAQIRKVRRTLQTTMGDTPNFEGHWLMLQARLVEYLVDPFLGASDAAADQLWQNLTQRINLWLSRSRVPLRQHEGVVNQLQALATLQAALAQIATASALPISLTPSLPSRSPSTTSPLPPSPTARVHLMAKRLQDLADSLGSPALLR